MIEALKIEQRSVAKLIPYAANSRTHSDAQVAQIAASIKEFGWTNPILVSGDNSIIAGHGRLMAARKLDMEEVPVIVLDHLNKAQQRALVIADNQLALNAGWDSDMLKAEIDNLKLDDFNIDLLAFSDAELSALFLEKEDGKTDADEEWQGMPEFEDEDPCFRKVIVSFDTPDDVAEFFSIIGQSDTGKTKSIWFPEKERRDLESLRWAEDE
jgi:ParB-like chromosome segregation protein Spo0J